MNEPLTHDIPGPKPRPIVGNLLNIDQNKPIQSFMALAREYGPIFRLEFSGRSLILCGSQELVIPLANS
jgi:cytochrome P450 / NADPH-cytochrome P450 reductase